MCNRETVFMKYKNLVVVALLSAGSLVSANPGFDDVLPNVRNFVSPLVSETSTFLKSNLPPVKTVLGSTLNDGDKALVVKNIKEAPAVVYGKIEGFLKNNPALGKASSLNAGFADLEAVDRLPNASNEGALKGKVEQAKNYFKAVFAPKPAAVVEQEKVKEKVSLLTQISENPGTTAALTAGTVIALYGSYKLIQYFDQKKARNIALAKRLEAQRKQSPVVFE